MDYAAKSAAQVNIESVVILAFDQSWKRSMSLNK